MYACAKEAMRRVWKLDLCSSCAVDGGIEIELTWSHCLSSVSSSRSLTWSGFHCYLKGCNWKGEKNGTVRSLPFDCIVGIWYLCYLQLCELCIIDRCMKGWSNGVGGGGRQRCNIPATLTIDCRNVCKIRNANCATVRLQRHCDPFQAPLLR